MACFDLYRSGAGLVVDVQSDLTEILSTRVVVPLIPPDRAPKPARRLNPVFDLPGTGPAVLVTQYIAALPRAELGAPMGSLTAKRDAIRAALDMLFLGF